MSKVIDISGPLYNGMWSYNVLGTLGAELPDFHVERLAAIPVQGFEAFRYSISSITGTYIENAGHMLEGIPPLNGPDVSGRPLPAGSARRCAADRVRMGRAVGVSRVCHPRAGLPSRLPAVASGAAVLAPGRRRALHRDGALAARRERGCRQHAGPHLREGDLAPGAPCEPGSDPESARRADCTAPEYPGRQRSSLPGNIP
jgi:hypothetical protein